MNIIPNIIDTKSELVLNSVRAPTGQKRNKVPNDLV